MDEGPKASGRTKAQEPDHPRRTKTGFILGAILAALFVTAWEMFGTTVRTALAEPGSAAADADYRPKA